MHQMRLLSASLVLAFGLSACGGSDSTSAPAVPVASASSGVLVDDLIAGATVFCDDNSNGVLDAGEIDTPVALPEPARTPQDLLRLAASFEAMRQAVQQREQHIGRLAYLSRPGRFFGRFLNKSGDLARQDLRASRGV